MSYSDRYKKNTNKFKSANPIFEEWISEWKEDAIAKDLQSKHTYDKCLNSIRKYPLPLKSGKECIILMGFGDKICKMIDDKLRDFLNEGGKLHDDEDVEILSEEENEPFIENKPEEKTKTKSKKANKKSEDMDLVQEELIDKSESIRAKYPCLLKQTNLNTESRAKQLQKTKSWTQNSSDDEIPDKEDEENFNKNKKVKKSSRSKEYVPEFRSGAYALLITLLKNEEENQDESINYMLKSQLCKDAQKHSDSQFVSNDPKNHYTAWNSMSNLIKKNFVDKENKLPARYRLTDSGRALARKLLYGISENDENKSNSDSEPIQVSKVSKKSKNSNKQEENCIEILSSDSEPTLIKSTSKPISPVKTSYYKSKSIDSDSDALEDIDIGGSTGLSQQFSNSKIIDTYTSPQASTYTSSITSSYTSAVNTPNVLYSFPPGSYDIILFIDNCETNAKKQDILIDEIKKSNIKHEFGKLHVGDFTWIARSRSGSNPDLILNYIIERKRMDDLCSSIIDGRYKEQKFRLKKCGITNAIYMIEDYGSMKHMSLPEKSLVQADINTQMIDKFLIHHTTDPKDSAHYLIHMTKFLINRYNDLRLNACTKNDLENYRQNCKNLNDASNFLIQFKEFNEFSNKNKPLSVKEMFAKCLMKIQGLSQEKVIAIVEIYPTLSHLIKEFSKCSDENSRIKLIANIKHGAQQRNIGPAAAKIIVQLFYTNTPLP